MRITFLLAIATLLLFSCENSSKNYRETDDIQEMVDKICEAMDCDDFERQQFLCDDMYSRIKDINHCKAKVWLSSEYFFLCCYNGGGEEQVKMKMELYTEKYLGSGILYESVKDMDAIWFSNIDRSAKLIQQAYEDNPSRTEKLVNDNEFEAYQAFARIVLRKR